MKIYGFYNSFYNQPINFTHKNEHLKPTTKQWNELRVFNHHIYEHEKGLRTLILTTEKVDNQEIIEDRLKKKHISYLIQNVDDKKINVFFGKPEAVEVIKSFNQPKLNKYTPEQDFILGTLLGYDKVQQCQRYMGLVKK